MDHPDIQLQTEIGLSSWFGFSLVVRPGSDMTRLKLRQKLDAKGFETRPIVTGNFAKNDVIQYYDYEIAGTLENADHIDSHGLFVGNHHYDLKSAATAIRTI